MVYNDVSAANQWGVFSEKGSYLINTPNTPSRWENVLFNDEYVVSLSQRLTGKSHRVERDAPIDIFESDRMFFINAEDDIYRLFHGEGKTFQAEYDLGSCSVNEEYDGFSVNAMTFVPVTGKREFWKFRIVNTRERDCDLNFFCHFPFSNKGPMGGECRLVKEKNYIYKFSFPYHVFYEDMEKVKGNYAYSYIMADCTIDSYDGARYAFMGYDNPYKFPNSVIKKCCSDTPGEGDDLAASVMFKRNLKPGESMDVVLLLGCATTQKEIDMLAEEFPSYESAYDEVKQLWDKRCQAYRIESPYLDLNHLFNRWFLKQAVFLARLNRSSVYCPVRNQLQDAVGYSMVEPEEALKFALKVLKRQHKNGYLKQWYMTDGSQERDLCKIEHSDSCIWLVLCIVEIINNIGDREVFMQKEPYMDCACEDTILEHLKKAVHYMAEHVGVHGLCLLLDGDWTDPINGAGRKGKGESVWNSMALIFAIKQLTSIFPDKELDLIADTMAENINRFCWDGEWYIAGFDDEGVPFGKKGDNEAEIFLNTQTWAFIAGIVPEEYKEILERSIEKLRLPFGYQLLAPAFDSWNETWGRISIKQKGTTENGSVYCHASMFKALGDCMQGRYDKAFETIISVLPINPKNPVKNNLQLPLYVPNYYFSMEGKNYGKSSSNGASGTNAWLIWVMIKYVLGVKITVDSISFEDHVPTCLQGTKIYKKYRNIVFKFEGKERVST